MPTALERQFPNLAKWIADDGWVELGGSPYDGGAAKAFSEGGCIFEGKSRYSSLDAMLKDLDAGIATWCRRHGVDLDE